MCANFAQGSHFISCPLTPEQTVHVRKKPVMLYSLLPRSMAKMFQILCCGPNMNFAVGCSDRTPSAHQEFSCLEWLIPPGELLVASDLDKDCLARGTLWGFRVPVVTLRHSVTGVNPEAEQADRFLPAFVAEVSKHARKDSEVAPLRTLPRDGPGVMPGCAPEGVFELQCCRPRGPALACLCRQPERGSPVRPELLPRGRRVPAPG